jgi:micrococcal nuclease
MMKTLLPLAGILAATLSGCSTQSSFDEAAKKTASAAITVTRVKDGDTFEIAAPWSPFPKLEWSVRVLGIDTPEKGYLAKCQREKDRALQASDMARDLIAKSGNEVTLSRVKHDKYGGRFDADVTLKDGTSYAKALLDAGLAKQYNGNGPKPNWCF